MMMMIRGKSKKEVRDLISKYDDYCEGKEKDNVMPTIGGVMLLWFRKC